MNNKYLVLYSWLLFFSMDKCAVAQAQLKETKSLKNSMLLDGKISLDSLTRYIHKNSGIRFSFNSVKVKGSKEIYFPTDRYSVQQVLQQIKKTTSLYYSFYSGYVIFQDNPLRLKQAASLQKTTTNTAKKSLIKISNESESRTKKANNQTFKKSGTIVTYSFYNDAEKKKPVDIIPTENNYSDQQTKEREAAQNKKPATKEIGFNDTSIAVSTEKGSPRTLTNKKAGLIDSSVTVIESNNKDNARTSQTTSITSIKKNNQNGAFVTFGVQWNVSIPTQGLNEYFTSTNGKSQPYNFLLPGLWISKKIGRRSNEIVLLLKAGQQYFTSNKVIETYTDSIITVSNTSSLYPVSSSDTTKFRRKTFLIKTNGLDAGLLFNYHLKGKWNIGGGLDFNWQYAALINQQTTFLSNGGLPIDIIQGIKKSAQEWKYLHSFFVTARLEASRNLRNFDIGCAAYTPITHLFTAPVSNGQQVNAQIFIRWRIN